MKKSLNNLIKHKFLLKLCYHVTNLIVFNFITKKFKFKKMLAHFFCFIKKYKKWTILVSFFIFIFFYMMKNFFYNLDQSMFFGIWKAFSCKKMWLFLKVARSNIEVAHKWRKAVFNNFWHPLPPSLCFLVLRHNYCCHEILDTPSPLRPWRHLCTAPYPIL